MLDKIKKLFEKKKPKPGHRIMYAVTTGDYVGKFIVFIGHDDTHYQAVAVGGKESFEPLSIPIKDIELGLKTGVLDMVRKIPMELYELCCGEYNYRLNEPKKDPYKEFNERHGKDESTD